MKKRVELPTGKEVEVKIPAGLADGQQIRLKGPGAAGSGSGKAGDLLITVSVAPDPLFERDGNDLRLELPITLYEAVLGGKVRVPTLDGAVELAIPPAPTRAAPSGSRARAFRPRAAAAILWRPSASCCRTASDADLEALMKKWRDSKPYDPRKGLT